MKKIGKMKKILPMLNFWAEKTDHHYSIMKHSSSKNYLKSLISRREKSRHYYIKLAANKLELGQLKTADRLFKIVDDFQQEIDKLTNDYHRLC